MLRNHRLAWGRAIRSFRLFIKSEVGNKALLWFGLLFALLLSISGLNVVNSYVGRDFMTAVSARKTHEYTSDAILYLGVFAGLTVVNTLSRFAEERLRLLSRFWLTRRLLERYLSDFAYYKIKAADELDNPDQRITEDVKAFTQTTLSFFLLTLNATITSVAFLGVLWSITPWLVLTAVLYAVAGSGLTLVLGRRLVELDNLQLRKEADLRYRIIQVREEAETIAATHVEPMVRRRLMGHLMQVINNNKIIIRVTRNLNFGINGYNYLIQLVPLLIVAPLYMRGRVEFGVVTQSAMAFSQVVGAFSLIVTQFETLSSFAAVSDRLNAVEEATESAKLQTSGIEMVEAGDRLALEGLVLSTPKTHSVLVRDLTIEIIPGESILILGSNPDASRALFLAVAGVWPEGRGRIVRPKPRSIQFVSRRPFIAPGTLREELLLTSADKNHADSRLLEVLRDVGLDHLVDRSGGLDNIQDWPAILSHADQQLVAIARLLISGPRFAFLDRATSDLGADSVELVYRLLSASSITYLTIGEGRELRRFHRSMLEILDDGKSVFSKDEVTKPIAV